MYEYLTLFLFYFLEYRYFRQPVSLNRSTIKIPDEVPRDELNTIRTVFYSAGLDKIFKANMADDPLLR